MANVSTVYNDKRVRGIAVDNLRVNHKHTSADSPQGNAGAHALAQVDANSEEAAKARMGQHWATHSNSGPFALSNGMHSTGKDHSSNFADAVNYSGGVRQNDSTTDPAPGVGRAPVKTFTPKYKVQSAGSGDTFRKQQSRRIGRKV